MFENFFAMHWIRKPEPGFSADLCNKHHVAIPTHAKESLKSQLRRHVVAKAQSPEL
jgi:hypothetical protein